MLNKNTPEAPRKYKRNRTNHPIYSGKDYVLYHIADHYYFFFARNDKGKKQFLCQRMWDALFQMRSLMESSDPIFVEFKRSKADSTQYDLLLHEIAFDYDETCQMLFEGKQDVCFLRAKRFIREWEKGKQKSVNYY